MGDYTVVVGGILWKGPRYTFWHTMLLNSQNRPSYIVTSGLQFYQFCGKVHDMLSDKQCYWMSQNRPSYIVISGLHFYQILWKGPRYTFWHTMLLNVTKPSFLYRYIGPAFLSNSVERSTIYFLTCNAIECHKTCLLISLYRACISIKFCEKVHDILSDIQCYWMSQNRPSYIVISGLHFYQILWKGPRYTFWHPMLLNVTKPSFLYRYIGPAFLSNSVKRPTIYFLTYNVIECHKTVLRISLYRACISIKFCE